VLTGLADNDAWTNHVELGRWADLFILAPLSCNTLAKMAHGLCDNLVLATYLSATCPVVAAPAMDEDMWRHPATRANLAAIETHGITVLPVETGELASGLYGDGRMAEPEKIVAFITGRFFLPPDLAGKNVLVSAGPTQEAIDPVRYISNHSSGKMGIALAEALAARGATVQLVLGPVNISPRHPAITVYPVQTANDMYRQCVALFDAAHIAVMAAAVADYAPAEAATQKIKKNDSRLTLELVKTKDILKTLGSRKKNGQLLVGFALETTNGREYALHKLEEKNADLIVLNSLQDAGAGFALDTNKITIFAKDGSGREYGQKPKQQVARDIVDTIVKLLYA
jgi:phosphopantothenoylcysteine decarboxylase/phosphopantothenate--cysteine ligase